MFYYFGWEGGVKKQGRKSGGTHSTALTVPGGTYKLSTFGLELLVTALAVLTKNVQPSWVVPCNS
jgi:hypothetical protein